MSDGIIWPEHQERLQKNHNELLKNMDIKPILPEFYSRGTVLEWFSFFSVQAGLCNNAHAILSLMK